MYCLFPNSHSSSACTSEAGICHVTDDCFGQHPLSRVTAPSHNLFHVTLGHSAPSSYIGFLPEGKPMDSTKSACTTTQLLPPNTKAFVVTAVAASFTALFPKLRRRKVSYIVHFVNLVYTVRPRSSSHSRFTLTQFLLYCFEYTSLHDIRHCG